MIKGTKAERVSCDETLRMLKDKGFRYLDSICVEDKTSGFRDLPAVKVGRFHAKLDEGLYYIFYNNPEDKTTRICDIFRYEGEEVRS